MYWVYFLYSQKKNNTYVGCTKNLKKRLEEHCKGLVKSTKYRRPLVHIHTEKYTNLSLAKGREEYLKSLYGYRERKIIVNCYLKNKRPYTKIY